MTALVMKPYTRVPPPADPESLKQFIDAELRKITLSITSIIAAVAQLQAIVKP